MIIYIDDNFKCYPSYQENLIKVDVPFFDGKCEDFISGYYYIPEGKEKEYNGKILKGSLAFPWKPYDELDIIQRNYEREQLSDMRDALNILLGQEE